MSEMSRLRFSVRACQRLQKYVPCHYHKIELALTCTSCLTLLIQNFLALCASSYYDQTTFHRNIAGFMVQGGDPSEKGKGGESIYGSNFEDEIRPALRHNARGIVSMANRGPGTNGSQFFITYASAPHLDGKNTVFGRVSPICNLRPMRLVQWLMMTVSTGSRGLGHDVDGHGRKRGGQEVSTKRAILDQ